MIILLLCYLFSSTLGWSSTVIDIVNWFNYHPFILIMFVSEVLCESKIFTVKIKK